MQIQLATTKYLINATVTETPGTLTFNFRYNPELVARIKTFDGARWNPDTKTWSIKDNRRNRFQLDHWMGKNPYSNYDQPLIPVSTNRNLFKHQLEMKQVGLTYHYCIYACEMGTGKSLAYLEALEDSGVPQEDAWYIGPKSGCVAVSREVIKWGIKTIPKMFTYEGLVTMMKGWQPGRPAPRFICFDESSRLKTPLSQRSQAAFALAEAVRTEHGQNGYVLLMTGTPAPKSPLDWYFQCEIACPGFLKEGNPAKFRDRLALLTEEENITTGIKFKKIKTWWDNADKCAKCGELKGTHVDTLSDHTFVASENEVARLHRRMKGLVLVRLKKDCLDLPEKTYEEIPIKPTVELVRAMKLITKSSTRGIEALTRIRELSDGFQYRKTVSGQKPCSLCKGEGKIVAPRPSDMENPLPPDSTFVDEIIECPHCHGTLVEDTYATTVEEVASPKDEYVVQLLDDLEDVGRCILWGGFTATVDKLVKKVLAKGWHVLCVDGRGYRAFTHEPLAVDVPNLHNVFLDAMDASSPNYQALWETYPRVCFIGHPKAGGMALTLTASPVECFYSNDFAGDARMQAEDRFHRAGMDPNRGARIIDLIMLPTDKLVLDNVKAKRDLQAISLGQITKFIEETSYE